jgi:F-type H+-transporting ATPase subunit epsilon
MKFHIELVTPERVVYSDDIDVLTIPTTMGEISILAHHMPIVATIAPGEMRIKKDGETTYLAISGGFVEVTQQKVTILADAAERSEEIDIERAEKARRHAQEMMEQAKTDKLVSAEAMAAFQRALIRIKVGHRRVRH